MAEPNSNQTGNPSDGTGNTNNHPTENRSGREDWRADREVDDRQLGTLWIRWTDGGSDMHLHRVCEIFPQVQRTSSFPWITVTPESGETPLFPPKSSDQTESNATQSPEYRQFQFVSGAPRQLLRHVPLLILVATVILFVGAEFTSSVGGISDLIPFLIGRNALLFGIFLAITPVLIWLLETVEVVEYGEFPNAMAIYGLVGALALGSVTTIGLVLTADHPSEVDPNVVLVSGYLLTLLIGGMLLYDGILRIEHLFAKLGDRDIVQNKQAYHGFLTDLDDALCRKTVLGIHPSRIFGFLFAVQFFIIWIIGVGPQGLGYPLGVAVNFVLNILLVTIVFQFFVIVRYLNRLLNETPEYSEVGLAYEPFHVDGYGGFRDFGRFAIRINIILSFAGVYVLYRLYAIGGRHLVPEGFVRFEEPLIVTAWAINYIGPIVAYGLGVLAWGYYSFWSLHKKMDREKEAIAREYQGQRGSDDVDRTPSAGDSIDSFSSVSGPAWGAFRDAPTWPLEINTMMSLISGNIIPLLLPVVNLFV